MYVCKQLPSELDVKWKMYRCHVVLRQHQEALDTVSKMTCEATAPFPPSYTLSHPPSLLFSSSPLQLSSIPLRMRNVQVATALGNLYKNFKSDR